MSGVGQLLDDAEGVLTSVRLEIVRWPLGQRAGELCCFTRHASLAQSTVPEHPRVFKEGPIRQGGRGSRSGHCIDKEALVWRKQAIVAL